MKTINKTIAIAIIAMAMCTASTYAEWFGIGGDNHILDDDELPDIYKFHDYEGKAIQPDMDKGNLGNVKPNIDTENNSYKGINVKPDMDTENYDYEYPGALPDMNTWKKKPTITKGLRKGVKPKITKRKKSSVLPAGNGGQTISDLATILNARIKSVVRPYNYTMAQDEDKKGAKLFDTPLIVGVAGFGMILYRLRNTVLSLCVLCCTLNIMFQAFRLWFGVQELKKTYVDIIWKSVCCILLLFSYPSIVDGVMTLASGAGMSLTNGYNDLNRAYKLAAEALYTQAELGAPLLEKVLSDAAVADKYVSEETYKDLMGFGYKKQDIDAVAARKQLIITKEVITPHEDGPGEDKKFIAMDGTELTEEEMYAASQKVCATNFGDALAELATKATAPSKEEREELTKKLHALMEVMDGQLTVVQERVYVGNGETKLVEHGKTVVKADDLIYAPFLKDKDKHNTTLISPAQMLRTCQVFGDAMTR